MTPPGRAAKLAAAALAAPVLAGTVVVATVLSACGSSARAPAPGTASVVSAPVRVAHTRLGPVGYRAVGTGPPLVLIMGYGWTMEGWDPRLVHALAGHYRVVMFDNSGIGRTRLLPLPLSIPAMASQTSALITALHLHRPDVLGWSMGGMIAQALAVRHPGQVRRLVLCATFPGTGAADIPPLSVMRGGRIFPSSQGQARAAYQAAIAAYPPAAPAVTAVKASQASAETDWWFGHDAAGREIARIPAPTLVADGTEDQLDPPVNDRTLARLIPRARLVLYPGAGHGFLFQDRTRFAALVGSFLTGSGR